MMPTAHFERRVFCCVEQLRHVSQSSAWLEQLYKKTFKYPPELLQNLSQAKMVVKNSIDKYKRVADKELLKMSKVRADAGNASHSKRSAL